MKYAGYSILFVFLISLVYACNNPLEDISIKIKDPLTLSAINLTYKNAVSTDTTLVPKNIKFTFLGEDAEAIVSSVGNKKINISKEGLLGIAIAPDYVKRPVNIAIVASLEGYLTDISYITLPNTTNINRVLRMFKINNLPKGMSVDLQNIESTNSSTLKTNGKNEQASLILSDGLNFNTQSGDKLTGKLSCTLTYFENSARDFVPSNYTIYQAVGLDNKVLPPFEFQPYGFFSFKVMSEKFEECSSLSKPCNVTAEISDNSFHVNGTKLKEGDTVPFWGYLNNVWKILDNPTVKRNASGKLSITSLVSSPTYYALGEMVPVCEKGPVLIVNSSNNGLDIYHYSRLIENSTGRQVGDLYLSLNNGAKYYLAGRRKNTVYLQVFNYNNEYGGDLTKPIFQSAPFDLCDEKNITVPIDLPPFQVINAELVIGCSSGKVVNEAAIPEKMYVQYQPKGATVNDWRDLVQLTRNQRKASTYKLKIGSRYSFRATPNPAQGWLFYQRDTLIKSSSYKFYIENSDWCK